MFGVSLSNLRVSLWHCNSLLDNQMESLRSSAWHKNLNLLSTLGSEEDMTAFVTRTSRSIFIFSPKEI